MRRLLQLTFAASLLAAVACSDATSPPNQAGPLLRAPHHTLVVPSTATPQVGVGASACALKTDGTVVCWGNSRFGGQYVPFNLPPAVQISVGAFTVCALSPAGSVTCWGGADADKGQSSPPPDLGPAVQVSVGNYHACAVTTEATVRCWGANESSIDYGQTNVPADLGPVTQVSAGGHHTCARTRAATVVCWGAGAITGREADFGQSMVPADLGPVTEVSAGYFHTCALKMDGTVACWGAGDGNSPLPVEYGQSIVPATLTSVAHVSAGGPFTCALKIDHSVVCWGEHPPVYGIFPLPPSVVSVIQLSSGTGNVCVVKTDGTVVCWRDNTWGVVDVPAGLDLDGTTPAEATANLLSAITDLSLPASVANSLSAPLSNINTNNVTAACGKLNAFINQVNTKLQHGQLTASEANSLLQSANAIKASLGCT